jgi:hypothetical protein
MIPNIGIGYKEYCKMHNAICESKFEKKGAERYLIYFGRAHVVDHETEVLARGPLKIGRGKWATALMRGRNQPGVDFRIYFEIILNTNEETYLIEKMIKDALDHRNIVMSQGQRELFNIKDEEIETVANTVLEIIEFETKIKPLEVNYFMKGK